MNLESNQSSTEQVPDEISLKSLILMLIYWARYLMSKWLIILLLGIVGASLGLIYSLYSTPIYTATTTFVLEDDKASSGMGNLAGLASIAGIDLGSSGGGIFQGDNILGLYKSRKMIELALLTPMDSSPKGELLINRYIDFNKLRSKWSNNPKLFRLKFTKDLVKNGGLIRNERLMDSVLGVIVLDINKNYLNIIKPDKKLSTIQVDVKSKDELFAKEFNNKLVSNVNEFYVNTKTKKTLYNVHILQHKTDSVRDVMNGAIYKAVAVGDATPNLNPTRQIQRTAPAQRSQFSAETNKAILAEMVKNLEITKMTLLRETPLIQVIDEPIYPLAKDKFGTIKGILIGGFMGVFFAMMFLLIRKIFKTLLL